MNKTLVVLGILGGTAAVAYYAFAKKFSSKLNYKFKGVRNPRLAGSEIEIPIVITIKNDNTTAMTINSTTGNLFYKNSESSANIARIERTDTLDIKGRTIADYKVFIKVPIVDLNVGVLQIVGLIIDKSFWRKFVCKGDISVTIGGQTFNIPFNETLQLAA